MTEKENPGIFDNSSDIGSLFESVTETPTIDLESDKVDLFSDKEEKAIKENEAPSLFEEKATEDPLIEKETIETNIDEINCTISDSILYIEGALKELASYQDSYFQIKQSFNILF